MLDYVLALDPGKRTDYAAIALLELPCYVAEADKRAINAPDVGWLSPSILTPWQRAEARRLSNVPLHRMPLRLIQSKRYPLRTKHHVIVDDIAQHLAQGPLSTAEVGLVVDRTGVGEGVVEAFEIAGLTPVGIFITGGQLVNFDAADNTYSVPKKDLADAIRIPLEERRLQFAPDLHDLKALKREMENFVGKISERGHGTYAAQTGNDDLVLAVCMACWYASRPEAGAKYGWGPNPLFGYRGQVA
jgi:hypothetical protein